MLKQTMNVKSISLMMCFIFVALCAASTSAQSAELVVFSGRKEPLIKPVIDLFEKKSGIKVTLKTGKSAALGQQILQELPNPSADVYIAKESGSLEFLRLEGAFDIFKSSIVEKIPEQFRARDGSWVGVSGRSRAVIYNKDMVKREDVPSKLIELPNPKFSGKLAAVNAGNESFIAWISALRVHQGDALTKLLLTQLKQNKIQLLSKSHTDIRKAVGRGEYPMGLINHYYYHLQKNETDQSLSNVGIVYLDQGEGERGEIVNVSGAAIVKGAKHLSEAKRFINFLVSPEAQKLFAETNYEYPLLPGVSAHSAVLESLNCDGPSAIDCLNVMDVHLDQLGPQMGASIELLDEVDWY